MVKMESSWMTRISTWCPAGMEGQIHHWPTVVYVVVFHNTPQEATVIIRASLWFWRGGKRFLNARQWCNEWIGLMCDYSWWQHWVKRMFSCYRIKRKSAFLTLSCMIPKLDVMNAFITECMSNYLRIPKHALPVVNCCSFFLSCPMSFLPLFWRACCIVSSSLAVKSYSEWNKFHPSLMVDYGYWTAAVMTDLILDCQEGW